MVNEELEPGADTNEDENEDENGEKPVDVLLRLVSDAGMVFFKDQYKIPHVMIPIRDHNEILRVESSAFKRYLVKMFWDAQSTVIGSESVKSATQVLQATAEYKGSTYPLSLRVAWYDDDIYYDMTNDKWHSIRISKDGWELVDKTPLPLFSRYTSDTTS